MRRAPQLLALATLAASLTACSFSPIGESTFECNRKENPSEYCRSFKALEKSTNGPLPESRFDKEFRMSDYDRATGIAPDSAKGNPGMGMAVAGRLPHQRLDPAGEPVDGMPLRKAPVVQRVFIKRFVDENDSLQDDVVVYREIKGPRWAGFDGAGQELRAPGAYPHRSKGSALADTEVDPTLQQTNLGQPDSGTDGAPGSAMPPAGLQSGGLNTTKAER
jgi:hypothetical protein